MKPAKIKFEISMEQLEAIDVRIGTILSCEGLSNSEKLVKLQVNFGDHERQILAGLKTEREDLAEVLGQQALFVVNLPERKMAGELSQGMLFDIGYADGLVPCLAVAEKEMPNGARAG